MLKKKHIVCDFCVVGGGMAGLTAAISAAREGLRVVLMHERPVLGGNASSEIRMWICGAQGQDNRETGILEEIALENLYRNPTKSYAIWDTVLYDFVRREANITLLLNCTCMDAAVEKGDFAHGRNTKIKTVTGYQMTTQCFYEIEAPLFCDSSGDSILAPLCGAEFRIGRESASDFGEDTTVEKADTMTMGMSCLLQGRETVHPIQYTAPAWRTPLCETDFESRNPDIYKENENFWYLELGGDKNTIDDTEILRDELLCLATGTWDYIKNSGRFRSETWDLDFLGFLPGKRESRRMCGEYMVTQRDISDGKVFEDEIAYGGWPLDDHNPYGMELSGENDHASVVIPVPEAYGLPYRALVSKNIENLMFAGRNISVTHVALSSTRVMATCALLGQAVGTAAAVAFQYGCSPEGVLEHIAEVQKNLMEDGVFLPHFKRSVSAQTLRGGKELPAVLFNGVERKRTDEDENGIWQEIGDSLTFTFPQNEEIGTLRLQFDPDQTRNSISTHRKLRIYAMKLHTTLDQEPVRIAGTIVKKFTVYADGTPVYTAEDNFLSLVKIPLNCIAKEIRIEWQATHGAEKVHLFSADFLEG